MKKRAAWRRFMFAVLILTAGTFRSAWAFRVEPARQEFSIRPGHSKGAEVHVFNDSPQPLNVEVFGKDWFVLPDNKSFPFNTWLVIQGDRNFTLKPAQGRKIHLTIKCPKEARGELVGMVSCLYRTEETSMVTPIISVSIYVSVQGTEKVGGEITALTLQYWQGQLQAGVNVKATGNVHLRPSGTFSLFDNAGHQIGNIPIKEAGPTYPGRSQPYIGADPNLKLAPGRYLAKAQLVTRNLLMEATEDFEVSADGQIKKVEGKH